MTQARDGIHMKFLLHKSDGSPCNPEACYFVLRLDNEGKDPEFAKASRRAAREFADAISLTLPALAEDIDACVSELERPPCGCREAACPHEPLFSRVWRYGE